MVVPQTSIVDVEFAKVEQYLNAIQKREIEDPVEITGKLLNNLNILKAGCLTLGGLLFFARDPQKYRPAFCVKAISFFGNSIGGTTYRSSQDISRNYP
jgi:predicted HTH transcriptional regulator